MLEAQWKFASYYLHDLCVVCVLRSDVVFTKAISAFEEGLRYNDGARVELIINVCSLYRYQYSLMDFAFITNAYLLTRREVGNHNRAHHLLDQTLGDIYARGKRSPGTI